MATEQPPHPFVDGPFVRIATFCERVLEEKDNTWTVVRIIDRYMRRGIGPSIPEEMEPFTVDLILALHLDAGSVRGTHEVKIRAESPSGLSQDLATTGVNFEGEERGVRFEIPGHLTVSTPGLYWFPVFFDGLPLTKVPLRIVYERYSTGVQS